MAAVGAMCRVEWMTTMITDQVNHKNNAPLFTRFFPMAIGVSVTDDAKPLSSLTASHSLMNSSDGLLSYQTNQEMKTALNVDASVYPNPTSELFTLRYFLPTSGVTTIDVVSMEGRPLVQLWSSNQEAGDHEYRCSINLPNGMYICRVTNGDHLAMVKIAIHR